MSVYGPFEFEYVAKEAYDEMLDDVHPVVRIGALEYNASRVLREVDPIAYETGFNDWLDSESEDWEDKTDA